MYGARIVEEIQRRPDLAHDTNRSGEVLRAHSAQTRGERFARDPASQIAGPSPALRARCPVVIRCRHRRVIAMREMARLGLEPNVVRRIGRAGQRQRAAEGVDDLLVMAMLRVEPLRPPAPAGWKLPVAQMRRQLGAYPVHAAGRAHARTSARAVTPPSRIGFSPPPPRTRYRARRRARRSLRPAG